MTLQFGEKAALDAYRDFCELQQKMIHEMVGMIAVLSNPQVAFSLKPPAKTEMQEDLEYMANMRYDPAEAEELLREAGFLSSDVK